MNKKCEKAIDLYLSAHYGEATPEQTAELQALLAKYPECQEQVQQIKQTLAFTSKRERPEPGAVFWDGYWAQLMPKLEQPPAKPGLLQRLQSWMQPQPHRMLQAGTIFAVLITGILIGRYLPWSQPPLPQDEQNAEMLISQTAQYLERSRVLLLGFVNHEDEAQTALPDLALRRTLSRDLVQEAARLRPQLIENQNARLADLLQDLEVILLQIANHEQGSAEPVVEMVRSAVERRAILFKINIEAMRQIQKKEGRDKPAKKEVSI